MARARPPAALRYARAGVLPNGALLDSPSLFRIPGSPRADRTERAYAGRTFAERAWHAARAPPRRAHALHRPDEHVDDSALRRPGEPARFAARSGVVKQWRRLVKVLPPRGLRDPAARSSRARSRASSTTSPRAARPAAVPAAALGGGWRPVVLALYCTGATRRSSACSRARARAGRSSSRATCAARARRLLLPRRALGAATASANCSPRSRTSPTSCASRAAAAPAAAAAAAAATASRRRRGGAAATTAAAAPTPAAAAAATRTRRTSSAFNEEGHVRGAPLLRGRVARARRRAGCRATRAAAPRSEQSRPTTRPRSGARAGGGGREGLSAARHHQAESRAPSRPLPPPT